MGSTFPSHQYIPMLRRVSQRADYLKVQFSPNRINTPFKHARTFFSSGKVQRPILRPYSSRFVSINENLNKVFYRTMSSQSNNVEKLVSWTKSITKDGAYKRKESAFRQKVTADGSSGFKAEAGRYHLYVSYACPWAHRTLIVRALKGLEGVISYSAVDYLLGNGGWNFSDDPERGMPDPHHNRKFLREVYLASDPNYDSNITVPILYDIHNDRIVNNESSEIIRMLNTEFNEFCATKEQAALDFYPEDLREQIDAVNEWVYPDINNGVYKWYVLPVLYRSCFSFPNFFPLLLSTLFFIPLFTPSPI